MTEEQVARLMRLNDKAKARAKERIRIKKHYARQIDLIMFSAMEIIRHG